jgi:hypothetical protein
MVMVMGMVMVSMVSMVRGGSGGDVRSRGVKGGEGRLRAVTEYLALLSTVPLPQTKMAT